jgi:hypothetical protein
VERERETEIEREKKEEEFSLRDIFYFQKSFTLVEH